jgi:hypothetical protein
MRKVEIENPENLLRDFMNTLKPGMFDLTNPQREMMSVAFHAFITGIYGSEPKDNFVEIGDYVDVIMGWEKVGYTKNILRAGKVIKKHSVQEGFPIAYDLEFTTYIDDETKTRKTTRIHNVSTSICVKRTVNYLEQQRLEEAEIITREDLGSFVNYTYGKTVSHADFENWLHYKKSWELKDITDNAGVYKV